MSAADKARADFLSMQRTLTERWAEREPNREQEAFALGLGELELTSKALAVKRNAARTVPAAAGRRTIGETTRDLVAKEAAKILAKNPEIKNRSALARDVARNLALNHARNLAVTDADPAAVTDETREITEKHARKLLEELGLPHPTRPRK